MQARGRSDLPYAVSGNPTASAWTFLRSKSQPPGLWNDPIHVGGSFALWHTVNHCRMRN